GGRRARSGADPGRRGHRRARGRRTRRAGGTVGEPAVSFVRVMACCYLTLVLGGAQPARAQRPAAWDAHLTNPKPASDDLVLPLPCGGAIAFRPVAVPSGGAPLDDRAIVM